MTTCTPHTSPVYSYPSSDLLLDEQDKHENRSDDGSAISLQTSPVCKEPHLVGIVRRMQNDGYGSHAFIDIAREL